MQNPVLAETGPLATSIPITVTLFDGSTSSTRGVVRASEHTPAEVEAPWADSGPLAWFDFAGDPEQIEFLQYDDPITDEETRRRVIFRERQAGSFGFRTVHAVLQDIDLTPVGPSPSGPAHGRPDISGQPIVGQTLVATLGSIADPDGITTRTFPADFTFQWTRGGTAISMATSDTYTVVAADVGEELMVEVRFFDDAGNAEGPLRSSPVTGRAAVAPRSDPYLYMATKPLSDTSEFTPADFLAGFSEATSQTIQATGTFAGQTRIAFALRSDLGPATIFEQHGRPPNQRNTLQPPEGDPNDVITINGGEYFRYTRNGSLQGFLVPLIPWELS